MSSDNAICENVKDPKPTVPLLICTWFLKNQSGKNQVRWTGFVVYFELDLISKLIFAGKKSSLSNLIFTTWFFKNQVQINRGSMLAAAKSVSEIET